MFDMDKIMQMSADEIIAITDLKSIAEKAKAHAKLIREKYRCFGIGEDKIVVWRDSASLSSEYLTYTGVWQARYLHQTYNVECTADSIFDLYRAEYLVEKGFIPEYKNSTLTTEGEKKRICSYFKAFVSRINTDNESNY